MNEKKVLLITGSTKGIGLETARIFGEKGYIVLINGHNEERGGKILKEFTNQGIKSEFFNFDVTIEQQVKDMISSINRKFGRIDVLVNNAGGLVGRSSYEDMTTGFWDEVIDLNLKSAFLVTRECIPLLKKTENGSIINMASIAAYNGGGPGAGVYALAKAGIIAFTKSLAKELIIHNIRVNAISPGTIDTDFHKETPQNLIETWVQGIPAKRLGQPLEVAKIVYFLASKEASYIVGETIQVNGGQMMI